MGTAPWERGRIRRIAVMGCPGAGKTTFALRLSAVLGIDVVHLDRLHYCRPGSAPPPPEEWVRAERVALAREEWIADGNYPPTQHLRQDAADAVIVLDFPRSVCLRRALTRMLIAKWAHHPDLPDGCRRRLDPALLIYIWRFARVERPAMLQRLREIETRARVVHLTDDRQARRLLADVRRDVAAQGPPGEVDHNPPGSS